MVYPLKFVFEVAIFYLFLFIALCVRCHARYDYALKQRAARVALERLKHQRQREWVRQGMDHRWFGG